MPHMGMLGLYEVLIHFAEKLIQSYQDSKILHPTGCGQNIYNTDLTQTIHISLAQQGKSRLLQLLQVRLP